MSRSALTGLRRLQVALDALRENPAYLDIDVLIGRAVGHGRSGVIFEVAILTFRTYDRLGETIM